MTHFGKYQNTSLLREALNRGEIEKPYVAIVDNALDYNSIDEPNYRKMPLTFEITGNGNIVWKAKEDTTSPKTIEYSKDKGTTWTSITSTTGGTSIPVVSGDTVQFRGDNQNYGAYIEPEYYYYSTFSGSTAQFKVKGNIMSLINSTNFSTLTTLSTAYTFFNLFNGCTGLTDASNLILPATTLAEGCYLAMFSGCKSLTTAPSVLPATILTERCYAQMFYGCTNLTQAPELPATTLAQECYNWMFIKCTSLTTAPELPATTLAENCYLEMFRRCSNLNYIKCLATDISAFNCTYNWVGNVASSGTFVKAASMNDWTTDDNGIPSGWTVQDAS